MKKDLSAIPKGDYCYSESGRCPYWRRIKGRPEKLSGFCDHLGKGDLELAKERSAHRWVMTIRGKGKKRKNVAMTDRDKKIFFDSGAMSLLWDEIKECGKNIE